MNEGGKIYSLFSLGAIAIIGFVLFWQPILITTIYEDFNYHLMVAQNYERAGGVVTWDFWETLPGGRPQNYPPLLHILLIPFIQSGLSPYEITTTLPVVFVMINLLLGWLGIKLLFGERTAFFFILAAISYANYIVHLGVIIPSSIVLISTPLLIYLITRGRWIGSGLLLATMFYTHMAMPYLVSAALLMWVLFYRKYWKIAATTFFIAGLLYLPWGLNVIQNREYITYLDKTFDIARNSSPLTFPVIHLALLVISITYLGCDRKILKNKHLTFFLIAFLVQTPILFYKFPTRFVVGVGSLVTAILVAYALNFWWQQNDRTALARTTAICFLFGLLFINIDMTVSRNLKSKITPVGGIISSAVFIQKLDDVDLFSHVYNSENLRIADAIAKHSDPDDLIYNTSSFLSFRPYDQSTDYLIAQYFAVMSNRAKVNARTPEHFWHKPLPLSKAKIVIADYHETNLFPGKTRQNQYLPDLAKQLQKNFEPVHQEDRLVVYKNLSNEVEKVQPGKPVLNKWLAWFLILITISAIGREVYMAPRLRRPKMITANPDNPPTPEDTVHQVKINTTTDA